MTDVLVRVLQRLRLYGLGKRLFDGVLTIAPSGRRRTQAMLNFYGQFVSAGDLCFDVGANMGSRVAVLRALGANVIAVEPQKACIDQLRKRFGRDPSVTLMPVALGRTSGTSEMLVSQARSISSLSKEWVNAVKSSGRFAAYSWDETLMVPVTTLDSLIQDFGLPCFCKIDVEGFEAEVLAGLSKPIEALSFEFTPELTKTTVGCVAHLAAIGAYEFNFDVNESMQLQLTSWVGPQEIIKELTAITDYRLFGDVYARLKSVPD
jgi:FkbM family methyltransferase